MIKSKRFSQYEQDQVASAYVKRKLTYSEQTKINRLRAHAQRLCQIDDYAEVRVEARNRRNPNGLEATFIRDGHKFKSSRFVSMSWVLKKLERDYARKG